MMRYHQFSVVSLLKMDSITVWLKSGPTALKGFHPWCLDGQADSGKSLGSILETVRCKKLILSRDIGWGL